MMARLDEIKYVGIPVASATLTLTFPHLFGTVDYIVPGLLHCIRDDRGTANLLWKNLENEQILQECLLLTQSNGMSPNQARDLAKNNYQEYIQELWNIKRNFQLTEFEVGEIEIALWSYGICYIKRQQDKKSQNLPFRFQANPNPPNRGLFAKNCPNS